MTTLLLLDAPSAPPPLALARLELDRLQYLHDRTLAEAIEAGSDGELEEGQPWGDFLRRIQNQRNRVTLLEAQEAWRHRFMPDIDAELLEGVRL